MDSFTLIGIRPFSSKAGNLTTKLLIFLLNGKGKSKQGLKEIPIGQ